MTAPRVLVVAPRWLGDAVLCRMALARLGARCRLEILAPPGVRRVLEDLAGVEAVHTPVGEGRSARLRTAARLRGSRFDAGIVFAPSFSSALALRLAAPRLRVGRSDDWRSFLLTHALPDRGRDVHLAVQQDELARALLGALGLPQGGDLEAPPLRATEAERQAAGGLHSGPYLVVAPGARFGPSKRYPPDRFAAAAALFARPRQLEVLLVGAPEDAESVRAVSEHLPQARDLCGRTSLPALLGLLAGATGVLANDSGTMHVAAALGVPVVGVFGSSNPAWTAPHGERAGFVVHPVVCWPCYAPHCTRDFGCMLGIAPEMVATALEARLEAAPLSLGRRS